MKSMRVGMLVLMSAGTLLLVGCPPPISPPPPGSHIPTPPTLSLADVVAGINQNAGKITSLWAHQTFEANIVDPQNNKAQYLNGDGTLMYLSPGSIYLVARKDAVGDLFRMGMDGQKFWMERIQGDQTFWYGSLRRADRLNLKDLPIRPDLILDVLGVMTVDADLTAEPAPVMRYNNEADAYMLVWQMRGSDHWVAQREVWYDRTTLLPERVFLFDPQGRVQVCAKLSNFINVEDSSGKIAGSFQLLFPETGSKMALTLSDVVLKHNGRPMPASFRMPDPAELMKKHVHVIGLDE